MKIIYSLALTGAMCGCLYASPPISGGFMTGADSAIYVYWFHPDLYHYEQGMDGSFNELNLAPGDVPGEYSIIQKAGFPFMSYISEFRIKVNQGDDFPSLPGDQFSLFGYAVYVAESDSLPNQPAVFHDTNRLCDGIPCGDNWAENPIGFLNLDGSDLWFGLEWMDSTTTAPQIKCAILPGAESYNKLGVKTGESYTWNDLIYFAMFRYRFLSIIPVDSAMTMGWRHELTGENRPDSFLVACYDARNGILITRHIVSPDTLCLSMPPDQADSIEITAFHEDVLDDSCLVLTCDHSARLPMMADFEFETESPGSNAFNFIIHNTGPSPLNLTLGYDKSIIDGSGRNVNLDAYATASVSFSINTPEADSLDLLIVIRDNDHEYYPFLARTPYPPQIPTEVEASGIDQSETMPVITIRPNPCYRQAVLSAQTVTRSVTIEIFNIIGQRVAEQRLWPGGEMVWDGRDLSGQKLPSGIYLTRIMSQGKSLATRKFVLLH